MVHDWYLVGASGAAALATILLALAAFVTILKGNSREKRERRERSLREIIDWSLRVSRIDADYKIPEKPLGYEKTTGSEAERLKNDALAAIFAEKSLAYAREIMPARYVNLLSEREDRELYILVNDAIEGLKEHLEVVDKRIKEPQKYKDDFIKTYAKLKDKIDNVIGRCLDLMDV